VGGGVIAFVGKCARKGGVGVGKRVRAGGGRKRWERTRRDGRMEVKYESVGGS